MYSKISGVVGLILEVIGLGGILDDLRGWRDAMNWLSANVPGSCDFAGRCGQWTFIVAGVAFIGLAFVVRSKNGKGGTTSPTTDLFSHDLSKRSQFKIRFDQSFFVNALEFDEPGLHQGMRTTLWVEVRNATKKQVPNVVVELGPLKLLSADSTGRMASIIVSEYQRLPFRRLSAFMTTFTGKQTEPVGVISFNDKSEFLRIEGRGLEFAHHPSNQYKITLSVLGNGQVLGRSIFRLYFDEDSKLQMSPWCKDGEWKDWFTGTHWPFFR